MAETAKRVDIFIPRAASNREDPNLYVGINGVNYVLPKGKTSKVPDFVAEEIRRADAAAIYMDDQRLNMKKASEQPANM